MPARDRTLQIALVLLVGAHGLAAWVWPADLWGASHLAVWPRGAALAWTAAALAALVVAPRFAARLPAPRLPGVLGSLVLAALAAGLFFLVRERAHFSGDGMLLARSLALGEVTFWRAPLLVRAATTLVRIGARFEPVHLLAGMAIASGAVAVVAGVRLAAAIGMRRDGAVLVATLLAFSGASALFFGHVELYPPLVPALLVYLLLGARAVEGRLPHWPTWPAWTILCTLHLSAVCLAPAQLWLGARALRRGERGMTLAAVAIAAALAWGLYLVATSGGGGAPAAGQALRRLVAPYAPDAGTRHAFAFASGAHALALLSQALLVAPLALAAVPAILAGRRGDGPPSGFAARARFLGLCALGALALDVVFARELGPYRDWDALAPYAVVYLAWAGLALQRTSGGDLRLAALLAAIAGLHHFAPWIATQASAPRSLQHVHVALASASQWSPYARGYMYEEVAIHWRDRGDDAAALRAYEAATRAEPADARYRVGAGDAHARLGDAASARRAYEEALARRPGWPVAHHNLASLLAQQDLDLEVALGHALAATQRAPGNVRFLLTRGFVEMRLERFDAARATFEHALALDPGSPLVRQRLDELRALAAARDAAP